LTILHARTELQRPSSFMRKYEKELEGIRMPIVIGYDRPVSNSQSNARVVYVTA